MPKLQASAITGYTMGHPSSKSNHCHTGYTTGHPSSKSNHCWNWLHYGSSFLQVQPLPELVTLWVILPPSPTTAIIGYTMFFFCWCSDGTRFETMRTTPITLGCVSTCNHSHCLRQHKEHPNHSDQAGIHVLYLGWTYPMFTCVLQHHIASTHLVLRLLANFTLGADSVKLTRVILVGRCVQVRSALSVA